MITRFLLFHRKIKCFVLFGSSKLGFARFMSRDVCEQEVRRCCSTPVDLWLTLLVLGWESHYNEHYDTSTECGHLYFRQRAAHELKL